MKSESISCKMDAVRPGIVDLWNAGMVKGAVFSPHSDIPFCPTTAPAVPAALIGYDEAKAIHNRNIRAGQRDYHVNAFVHFYVDDQKFDGKRSSIWLFPEKALEIVRHFSGIISPDFSTYNDFPEPIKLFNTYRMRAFGYWIASLGIPVINNVRWGTDETYWYCFDGIPKNSIVSIGTVGGSPRKLIDRDRFESGLREMVRILQPHTIIVCGSANYKCFAELESQGIRIVAFPSQTSVAFERRKSHE